MNTRFAAGILAATSLTLAAPQAAHAQAGKDDEPKGSLYLQCDGKPNNMTDGESFARLLGAVTLLGLFAPEPEAPDPEKRLFGAEGVAACSQLITGERAEGNAVRRIPLILARALHQIEEKNYPAALEDVALARSEAEAAGLVGNPYFERSMGLAFPRIEMTAHLRLDDPEAAREAALAPGQGKEFATYAMAGIYSAADYLKDVTPEEKRQMAALAKIVPNWSMNYAAQLEEAGEFAEAAKVRRDLYRFFADVTPDSAHSVHFATAAVAEALAGEWENAEASLATAQERMDKRAAEGKPEKDTATTIEMMDLFAILQLAREGNLTDARRNFAARSRWVQPSLGVVMKVNAMLREGASEDELFGSLEMTPEELWQDRLEKAKAVDLEQDTDNKSLFAMIPSYADIKAFEKETKTVWREKKSRMVADEPFLEDSEYYYIRSTTMEPVRNEAVMLHAAVQAKARGKEGYMILMFSPIAQGRGVVRFMNRDELDQDSGLFVSADTVIRELGEIIPSPEDLKLRKKARSRR